MFPPTNILKSHLPPDGLLGRVNVKKRKLTKASRGTNNDMVFTLHLFAGAGGGILADVLLGHTPIGAVEIEPYARQILLDRQVDGSLPPFPVWNDVRTFRADNPQTENYIARLWQIKSNLCIAGGFPCQDISQAGRGAGITGTRSGLWKEYARIVGEIQPRYIFVENSPIIIGRGLDVVLNDIASLGYALVWGIVSAQAVGAPHLRNRFWAYGERQEYISNAVCRRPRRDWKHTEDKESATPDGGGSTVDDCRKRWNQKSRLGRVGHGIPNWLDSIATGQLWDAEERGIPRIIEECDFRRKRLSATGNAQVPTCAAVAYKTLKNCMERMKENSLCNEE